MCLSLLLGLFGLIESSFPDSLKRLFAVAFEVFLGAGVTILFIDRLNAYRNRKDLQRRLIREAGSRSHDVAISAVEWMDREGWLTGEDGLLKGANLREARLKDARMEGANLEGANLELADLRGAGMENAILKDANLVFAKAKGSVLNKARLENARMNSVDLDGAYLKRSQLENATLSHAKVRSANLDRARFRCAWMPHIDLTDSTIFRATFFKANLHSAKLQNIPELRSANFERATLTCTTLEGVDLEDCHLKGADLRMADLRKSNLLGANLHGANLYGALLEGAHIWLDDVEARLYHDNWDDGAGTKYAEFWQRATRMSDAVLPDGTTFTDDMDYDAIVRFTDRNHHEFARTLAIVEAVRDSDSAQIDWNMTLGEIGD